MCAQLLTWEQRTTERPWGSPSCLLPILKAALPSWKVTSSQGLPFDGHLVFSRDPHPTPTLTILAQTQEFLSASQFSTPELHLSPQGQH